MSLASRKLIQATAGAAGAADTGDDDFANVVLLLDGDGTSGDNNETFTDSSTNGFTVTETGSVVQGSFSPYGDNWSVFFDGVDDHIGLPANSNYTFGTADFTIESWIFTDGSDFFNVWQNCAIQGSAGSSDYFFGVGTSGELLFARHGGGSPAVSSSSGAVNNNEWTHIAVTRTSSVMTLWVNGTSVATSTDSDLTGFNITQQESHTIGYRVTPNYGGGYLSNLRVLNGTALYTSSFTPATAPLSAVTNTVFLGLQSNRFVDNSTVGNTVSPGGVKVTPFSPFKDDDARDITTDGGSAYFEYGATNALSVPADTNLDLSTGDFTVEMWVYLDSKINDSKLYLDWTNTSNYWQFKYDSSYGWSLQYAAGTWIVNNGSASNVNVGEWQHLALTRSGSNFTIWQNGESFATGTSSANIGVYNAKNIGGWTGGSLSIDGYISDFRLTKGTALYSSSFTPPTSPISAGANTELFLKFQDAGIYDRSGINNLDTVGNAQIDTAVKKYGTGSLEFDGSGDYLKGIASADELNMGTGDWTIEGWYYVRTRTTAYPLIIGNNDSGFNAGALAITTSNNDYAPSYHDKLTLANYDDGSQRLLVASSAHNLNQWYHFAVVRNGTNITIYRDGTSVASKTISSALTYDWGLNGVLVGGGNWDGANSYSDAIFDDLRITKGVARYTANFTPPTEEHPKF